MTRTSLRKWAEALQVGLLATGLQIALALSAAPAGGGFAYANLCRWDCSGWYEVIASVGYRSSIPPLKQKPFDSNVAFFPAFPMIGSGLAGLLGVEAKVGLVVLAQLACLAFWTMLWFVLRKWRVPWPIAALTMLAVLAHPSAFYLAVGYSESLFLASLLVFIASAATVSRRHRVTTVVSGTLMSATRIVGLPVASFPVMAWLLHRRTGRLWLALTLSVAAGAGALAFFAYCKLRFGQLDLYMQTQRIGWGIIPDYLAPFKWQGLVFYFAGDRWTTVFSSLAFLGLAFIETAIVCAGRQCGLRRRLPVYVTAGMIYYITLAGVKSQQFISITRYSLAWYVLLLLCLAHLLARLPRLPERWARPACLVVSLALLYMLVSFQIPHLRDYVGGRWVS